MADAIRALCVTEERGGIVLRDTRTGRIRRFRNENDILLASVMLEVNRAIGLAWFVYMEYQFHPTRKWRFDGAIPSAMVAVEVEGIPRKAKDGTLGKSRHLTVGGFLKDKEKYTAAEVMGWHVLRFVWKDVRDGSAGKQIVEAVRRFTKEA